MRIAWCWAVWLMVASVAVNAQPSIAFDVATDRTVYREGALNEVYVEARIRPALPVAAPRSTNRNVVLVLDRSGSMAGEPIRALREAVMATLSALDGSDFVAVVLFGSEVETIVEAQRRDDADGLAARIAQIEPAGGAALYDALNQGAAQLRRHAEPLTMNQLILVTDGPPTKGPREFDDFARLAEVFAREGMILSTIGLGEEFEEDVLVAMARIGHGRFHYVADPSKLGAALQAELAPPRSVVAHDAVLTLEFRSSSRNLRSRGWRPASIQGTTLTYRFPRLFAEQELRVLASAEIDPFVARVFLPNLVTARLRWTDAVDGKVHETSQVMSAHFSYDTAAIRGSIDAAVARTAVGALIREGLQKAIEQLDKGDQRRALRVLRSTRGEVRSINFDLEDPGIDQMIQPLDAYLADVQARGMNALDRKILRSGLFNVFDPPAAPDDPKK